MRTHMHRLTAATATALIAWSGPAFAPPAADYEASDYLPLAVGNSWTFQHQWDDLHDRFGSLSQWSAYLAARRAADPAYPSLTITVERTEEIDGNTYYVLSGMPENWPPAPPHFVAGKKLRWDGTRLVQHTGTGELVLYRFDGANEDGYAIPTSLPLTTPYSRTCCAPSGPPWPAARAAGQVPASWSLRTLVTAVRRCRRHPGAKSKGRGETHETERLSGSGRYCWRCHGAGSGLARGESCRARGCPALQAPIS